MPLEAFGSSKKTPRSQISPYYKCESRVNIPAAPYGRQEKEDALAKFTCD